MRIRDCSSDVCASDLSVVRPSIEGHQVGKVQPGSHLSLPHFFEAAPEVGPPAFGFLSSAGFSLTSSLTAGLLPTSSSRLSRRACVMNRSEESRVGKEFVRTFRYRCSPYH